MRNLTAEEWVLVSGGYDTSEDEWSGEVVITARRGGWWPSTWWSNLRRPTPPPPSDDSGGGGSHPGDEGAAPDGTEPLETVEITASKITLTPGLDVLDYLKQAENLLGKLTAAERAYMGTFLAHVGAKMTAQGVSAGDHLAELAAAILANSANAIAFAMSRCSNAYAGNLPLLAVLNGIIVQAEAGAYGLPGGN